MRSLLRTKRSVCSKSGISERSIAPSGASRTALGSHPPRAIFAINCFQNEKSVGPSQSKAPRICAGFEAKHGNQALGEHKTLCGAQRTSGPWLPGRMCSLGHGTVLRVTSANISTRGASGIVVFQETIFDFSVDRVQPLFRTFGPFPVSLDLRLELRNAIFRGAKLVREPLCGIQRLSAV